MRKFEDVGRWLQETSGAHLESVSLDEFRERIRVAVLDMKEPAGVLPQVKAGPLTSPVEVLVICVQLFRCRGGGDI